MPDLQNWKQQITFRWHSGCGSRGGLRNFEKEFLLLRGRRRTVRIVRDERCVGGGCKVRVVQLIQLYHCVQVPCQLCRTVKSTLLQ